MNDVTDSEIQAVADWLLADTDRAVQRTDKGWVVFNLVEWSPLPHFWSSLDAWFAHVWPKLQSESNEFGNLWRTRVYALTTGGLNEFAHASAAVRTKALASVLKERGAK